MVAYKAKVVPGRMDGSEVEVWVLAMSAGQQRAIPNHVAWITIAKASPHAMVAPSTGTTNTAGTMRLGLSLRGRLILSNRLCLNQCRCRI